MLETTKRAREIVLADGDPASFEVALCRDVDTLVAALRDGQHDPSGRLVVRVAILDLPAIAKSPEQVARELVAIWQQATRDAEYAVTKVIGQGPRTEEELLAGHNLEFNVRVELERDQPGAVLGESQGDASLRVEGGEVTVAGKPVQEAPPPSAATCPDCGWELKQNLDPPYTWTVACCYPEYHLVHLFHGPPVPSAQIAAIAIDKVPA